MGGPSAESKANEAAQQAFYTQMTSQQSQIFGSQQDLLKQINAISGPILAKGPNQYGFSPEEDTALKSAITDSGAKATADTINAQKLSTLQRTGGTDVLGSGAEAGLEENARVLGSQTTATNLANEKLAGYQQGNQNYTQALGAETGVAQLQSPTSYASAATGAGQSATDAVKLADSERSQLLSTLLGGAISGGLALATGGASKALNITPYGG